MKIKQLNGQFKLKSLEEDGTFSGYGSVFGVEDSYGDVVEKGAFKQTLKEWNEKGKLPVILWQHDRREPIGVYTMMKEDDHGLYVEGKLLINDDPLAKRAYAHLKAGSISGLSIGYTIPKGGAFWDEKTETYRLTQLKLWEVSIVTFPANEDSEVDEVKHAEKIKASITNPKKFEKFLRDAGLSRTQAKGLMASGFKALNQRDAGDDDLLQSIKQLTQQLQEKSYAES